MNSLFINFDLKFFWFQIFLFIFSSLTFFSFFFKMSFFNLFLLKIKTFFFSFFYSLKSFGFTKSSCYNFFMVFLFLFCFNFFSVFSYNFPWGSQVSLIFSFSLSFWLGITIFSLFLNFRGYISHFVPSGSPHYLIIFLFMIEVISSFIRPLTLMIRLVANILAGHLLMILLFSLVYYYNLFSLFYFFLNLVELFVALIQSYIFSTMMCLYFSEV